LKSVKKYDIIYSQPVSGSFYGLADKKTRKNKSKKNKSPKNCLNRLLCVKIGGGLHTVRIKSAVGSAGYFPGGALQNGSG
jgi:hypothetical protein